MPNEFGFCVKGFLRYDRDIPQKVEDSSRTMPEKVWEQKGNEVTSLATAIVDRFTHEIAHFDDATKSFLPHY
jgi:hypothetical protein